MVLHVDSYIHVSVSLPPVSSRYVLLRLIRLIRIHMLKGAVRRALLVSALKRASRLHRLAGDTGGGSTGSKQAVREDKEQLHYHHRRHRCAGHRG